MNTSTQYSKVNRTRRPSAERIEIKYWITSQILPFLESVHKDTVRNPGITAGKVMHFLDSLPDQPAVYAQDAYSLRYSMVKHCLDDQVVIGQLNTGMTTNDKGMPAICYSPLSWMEAPSSEWDFISETTTPEAASLVEALNEWLDEHTDQLQGLQGLCVVRKDESTARDNA